MKILYYLLLFLLISFQTYSLFGMMGPGKEKLNHIDLSLKPVQELKKIIQKNYEAHLDEIKKILKDSTYTKETMEEKINDLLQSDELNTCYRKLAQKFHPDKGGDGTIMQQLNDIKKNPHSVMKDSYVFFIKLKKNQEKKLKKMPLNIIKEQIPRIIKQQMPAEILGGMIHIVATSTSARVGYDSSERLFGNSEKEQGLIKNILKRSEHNTSQLELLKNALNTLKKRN